MMDALDSLGLDFAKRALLSTKMVSGAPSDSTVPGVLSSFPATRLTPYPGKGFIFLVMNFL